MAERYPRTAFQSASAASRGSSPSTAAIASSTVTLNPSMEFDALMARANSALRSSPGHLLGVCTEYLKVCLSSSMRAITSISSPSSFGVSKSIALYRLQRYYILFLLVYNIVYNSISERGARTRAFLVETLLDTLVGDGQTVGSGRRHECLSIPRHRERFVPGTWYTVLRCGALTEGARRATGVSAPQRDEAAVMRPPGASAWEAGAAVAWLPQTDPLHRHGTRHATGGRRWVPGRLLRLPVHGRRTHKYWPIASGLPARLGALANQRSIPPP